jgi:hypothetical protein
LPRSIGSCGFSQNAYWHYSEEPIIVRARNGANDLTGQTANTILLKFGICHGFGGVSGARCARRRATPQFGNSGDKIGQAVAGSPAYGSAGSFSATSGRAGPSISERINYLFNLVAPKHRLGREPR